MGINLRGGEGVRREARGEIPGVNWRPHLTERLGGVTWRFWSQQTATWGGGCSALVDSVPLHRTISIGKGHKTILSRQRFESEAQV